jgi:hypothetical protein
VTHWAAQYIGAPWDAADQHCWNFACRVWREVFHIEVAIAHLDAASPRDVRQALGQDPQGSGWSRVEIPVEGDAVLMSMGRRPCHVGVWAAPDPAPGILHAVEKAGVIFTQPNRLAGLGYRIVGFYLRAG